MLRNYQNPLWSLLKFQASIFISRCVRTSSKTVKPIESSTKSKNSIKWHFLEHKGPVLAPVHEPLPDNVQFYYGETAIKLSIKAEEVACFYASMLEHDYTTRELFNKNFFTDWRAVMNEKERKVIRHLSKCNFREIHDYYKKSNEERKQLSAEEKEAIKQRRDLIVKEYGYCKVDNHIEKISGFKLEPPGLFRGRGDHPKQGMLKKRVMPEDIIINCSRDSVIPKPPNGHQWKDVIHDNTVLWLASWVENINKSHKYIQLDLQSKLKGNQDLNKYESARHLHRHIDGIRSKYMKDLKRKSRKTRQCATATYLIDKLALRVGTEKDEDTADTVGCCSLRCEHLVLHDEFEGDQFVVELDFLGKDSIRYHNYVTVDEIVFKNLRTFMHKKAPSDDVFELLSSAQLNRYMDQLLKGLSSKVFRTYNASHTLQTQLDLLTKAEMDVSEKLDSYQTANRSVARLCNHQKAVPKNFEQQLEKVQDKIFQKQSELVEIQLAFEKLRKDISSAKGNKKEETKMLTKKNKLLKRCEQLRNDIDKLQKNLSRKEENKDIALTTSKSSYLDPRISVAWCKRWDVPVNKVYNTSQRERFAWAIESTDESYKFTDIRKVTRPKKKTSKT